MKKNVPMLALYVVLPVVLGVVSIGQFMAVGKIIPKMFLLNFVIAFILATIVVTLMPLNKIADLLIRKVKLNPHSLQFGLLMNTIINLGFSIIVGLGINILNVNIIGGAPLSVALSEWVKSFIPIFIIAFVISFVFINIYNKQLARKED